MESSKRSVTRKTLGIVEQMELWSLLANLKKSVELWFLSTSNHTKVDESFLEQIQTVCLDILKHGLQLTVQQNSNNSYALSSAADKATLSHTDNTPDANALQKLIVDFEWVRRSAQTCLAHTYAYSTHEHESLLASSLNCTAAASQGSTQLKLPNIEHFLNVWILNNLRAHCLCASLQALVADKELLDCYYKDCAFMQNERYATALFMCVSAFELNQYSLLSQVDAELYSGSIVHKATNTRHKRSNSHPNFSISPVDKAQQLVEKGQEEEIVQPVEEQMKLTSMQQRHVNKTFRKTKSLPIMQSITNETKSTHTRPRSKTMFTVGENTHSKRIPSCPSTGQKRSNENANASNISSSISSGDDVRPSTSACSKHSRVSSTPSNSHISSSSSSTAQQINLIKCDNIKIWTDQHWEQQRPQRSSPAQTINPTAAAIAPTKQSKSLTPINSILSTIFNASPTGSCFSYSSSQSQTDDAGDADAALVYPCNATIQPQQQQPQINETNNTSSGVFDAFLPIYGKKLRSRKSQNLFDDDDDISPIDYTSVNACHNTDAIATHSSATTSKPEQSLTSFLQMSQLSRNNTELEKENAHFRVSEAIISAIEHIKWAKTEPDKRHDHIETATATDWLKGEPHEHAAEAASTDDIASAHAHISYAELGESYLDTPCAEVVGLTLISKFKDTKLPKVSELKWLVSEEDTPQQLLPMPDTSASANPDDHIITSVTRGTRYWAPPRQQIIFTEHPSPNRRQLLRKQNNRCAGCGMRVAMQYIHNFRYCTYLGKYFCTGCHRNQISATPAKILQSWDFKCYPVSVFAYRLIEQMYTYPLFYVPDLNPALYIEQKNLFIARKKRVQLKFVKAFIKSCRFATREQAYFHALPAHITDDPDIWSMSNFVDAQSKSMRCSMDDLIDKCEQHIFNCVLCLGRGFLCEYCRKHQVIFPWENKTFRCDRCGACFHLSCWKSMLNQCCRCQRIDKRLCEKNEI